MSCGFLGMRRTGTRSAPFGGPVYPDSRGWGVERMTLHGLSVHYARNSL